MRRKYVNLSERLASLLGILAFLLLFQNCSQSFSVLPQTSSSATSSGTPAIAATPTPIPLPTGPDQLQFSWTAPAGGQVDNYLIELSIDGQNFVQVEQIPGTVTTAVITNLAARRTFYARIKSVNSAGESSFAPVIKAITP